MAEGVRFMRKGITKFSFVTTIAVPAIPTAAEINAGLNLTPQISTIAGLSWSNNPIQVPDMANTFVAQIGGEDTTEDTNMEFYALKRTATLTDLIFAGLVKGAVGYIVVAPQGIASGAGTFAVADKVDIWTVTITSKAKIYTADNEAAKYRVNFALTAVPTEDFAIAA